MRRTRTLRGRLALLALLTTALWVGLLTIGFNVVLDDRLRVEAVNLLHTRAAAVAETITVRPEGTLLVNDPRVDSALDADIWIYQGRVALERPSEPASLQQTADRLAGSAQRLVQLDQPFSVELFVLPVLGPQGQVGTVIAAVGLGPYRHTAQLALVGSLGLAALLLAGVYLLTRFVVSRALRPVHEMSQQAATWSADDAVQRFGDSARPGELAMLATNLDGLLDRLAAVLRHETQLTAELSHELRTPLARITAETDLLRSRLRGPAEQERAHAEILASAEQMKRILETLLSAARSSGGRPPGRCLVGPVVEATAGRLLDGRLPPGSLTVTATPADLVVGVEADIFERILSPLLDNAARYARSSVAVEATTQGAGVEIRLRDDGPGVGPGIEQSIFEPGHRGDPDDGHDGAGLGLPLARRLARAAGGEITLAPDEPSTFVVRLPAG